MAKPMVHAEIDTKRFGGKPEDYLAIHDWFDESKAWFPDNRHRFVRHHSQGIFWAEEKFGKFITNSDGNKVSVRDIGESHVLVDFGGKFIPTIQDYLQNVDIEDWMQNGRGYPTSAKKIEEKRSTVVRKVIDSD